MHQIKSSIQRAAAPVLLLVFSALIILPLQAQNNPSQSTSNTPSTQSKSDKPAKKAVATSKRAIDPKKITWLNFSDGLKYARAEKKHVLLDFTASWCGWCKKMDAETFADTTVINLINTHFIPVKVWSDSEQKLDIDGYLVPESAISQEMFKVQGLPTFHFLRPSDQKLVRGFSGYRQRDDMLKVLEFVKNEQYDTTKTKAGSPAGKG